MRRTERLFQIIQILRSRRVPVTGQALAEELEVSVRTLYRDIAELVAQRVPIIGEAGTGYILAEGYDLPPLMLTVDELEAAVLGASWVANQGDQSLLSAARDLVAKLAAVCPPELRPVALNAGLRSVATKKIPEEAFNGALLRQAIRERSKLRLLYADRERVVSDRIVWPILIAYVDNARMIAAWCETRQDFRHFRADRVQDIELLNEKYPERRAVLVKKWEESIAQRFPSS